MEMANNIYKEMKKMNLPLKKEERDNIKMFKKWSSLYILSKLGIK